ncbi:MAG: hypothetical protein HQL63_12090 [Magnetococcales bacterium]|nr:hypothetical protein [Magnetococcales bacterium]MBF0321668.1 hypothetical protein [Magnetococcales bacterium]
MREFEQNHFSIVIELVVGLLVTTVLLLLIGNAVIWGNRSPAHHEVSAAVRQSEPPAKVEASTKVAAVEVENMDAGKSAKVDGIEFMPPVPTPRPQLVLSVGQNRVTSKGGVIVISHRNGTARSAREELLDQLETHFRDKNLAFEVDRRAGSVFLPELFQFSMGSTSMISRKEEKIKKVLEVFSEVLPCYATGSHAKAHCGSEMSPARIKGVLIVGKSNHEGDQIRRATNMSLAFGRASTAFHAMLRANPKLFNLLGSDGDGLFRIEAMGTRSSHADMLRRVEFHFIMADSEPEQVSFM